MNMFRAGWILNHTRFSRPQLIKCRAVGSKKPESERYDLNEETQLSMGRHIVYLDDYIADMQRTKEKASRTYKFLYQGHEQFCRVQKAATNYGEFTLTTPLKQMGRFNELCIEFSKKESRTNMAKRLLRNASATVFRVSPQRSGFSVGFITQIQKTRPVIQVDKKPLNQILSKVVLATKMTRYDKLSNYMMCNQIDDMLRVSFPLVSSLPHGSTASELGCTLSDLDLLVHINGLAPYQLKEDLKVEESERDMMVQVLREAGNIIRREKAKITSSSIQFALGAKVPVISFISGVTGAQCDLSIVFSRSHSLITSHIFTNYARCFPPVRPLIYNLKLWARSNGVTSSGIGKPHVTTFALNHLVIYFLQTLKLVPTVNELQSVICNRSPESDAIISNWDTHSQSGDVIAILYKEFFKFYTVFDFENCIIDIRDGSTQPIPLTNHKQSRFTTPMKIVNTQEPSRNIAGVVQSKYLDLLQKTMRETSDAFATLDENEAFRRTHLK